MGGGDLNMKKSWHPLLLKNQEQVWLKEKEALEEKKKLDQLRKEKEEERQLQELQRLQEEKTGKKRTEKLEWMYSTPATGNGTSTNDLEDYLLGKKRVDKILTADENAKLGASHKNFIAVQNANNARDIAAKIREDPLLAIKQQQQAAFEALMANPLRLQEMQRRNGIKPKKDKAERKRDKEERKRLKAERKRMRDASYSRSPRPRNERSCRSPSPDRHSRRRDSRSPFDRRPSPLRSDERTRSSRGRSSRDNYSPPRRRDRSDSPPPRRRDRSDSPNYRRREDVQNHRLPTNDHRRRSRSRSLDRSYDQSKHSRPSPSRDDYRSSKRLRLSPPSESKSSSRLEDDRAARLAAMSVNATVVNTERQKRLAELLEKEKAQLAADEAARAQSKGVGQFLSQEQKKVFGGTGGLEDRIRRGRGGLVVDAD